MASISTWSTKVRACRWCSRTACSGRAECSRRRRARSPSPYDMEQLADDAATLIQKLNAAPCHFVGLSMGGFVGLRLALERPDLLRSLTLIESAAAAEPRLN